MILNYSRLYKDPILAMMIKDGVPMEIAIEVIEEEYPYFWYDYRKLGVEKAFAKLLRQRVDPRPRLKVVR